MNAILQYLDAIATALEKMSGKTVSTASGSKAQAAPSSPSSVSVAGSVNTEAITAKIGEALVVTESEEQDGETVETRRSVYDVIREDVEDKLREALFVTETGGQETVQKSVFEAIRDDLYALSPTEEEEEEVNNG